MKKFAHHASHCAQCANPYEVHRSGSTLCARGHRKALDVAQYVYNKSGQAYSLVDKDSSGGTQQVRIEIPAGCEAVRSLLKAMERGLRLGMAEQPKSFDRTYYVPGRKPTTIRYETPRLETAIPPPYGSPPRRGDSRRYMGKGSMFEQDMRERERYYDEPRKQRGTTTTIYRVQTAGGREKEYWV